MRCENEKIYVVIKVITFHYKDKYDECIMMMMSLDDDGAECMMMMSLDDDLPVLEVVAAPDQFSLHTRSPDQ